MYPAPNVDHDEMWEESSQEEKTKQLLTVVRDVVKNANVVDLPTIVYGAGSDTVSTWLQKLHPGLQQPRAVVDSCPSKSASNSSIRTDRAQQDLVSPDGPLKGTAWQQFKALMWLMFLLVVLPTVFVTVAMAFSMLRPPADNEIALKLDDQLYRPSTEFLVPPPVPSEYVDPKFVESILHYLMMDKQTKNWTRADNPQCECTETRQQCNFTEEQSTSMPEMMLVPDSTALNKWLVDTQELYIEKRMMDDNKVMNQR
ncbi:hypothetical protein HF086_016812 [Spodoptera exigua]|uniref:Uncharacterized protein n=1 Tax=Spodoptera exigua TaxID=7107 RepID=A0A922MKP2_SPOEX|nr:hypothetical protein HF086_016812 [Spodoptera exigua]